LTEALAGLDERGWGRAAARLRRERGEFERAQADLDEARSLAERGGMRLHLADYHLEAARLALAAGDREAAPGTSPGRAGWWVRRATAGGRGRWQRWRGSWSWGLQWGDS
jgi:hypothetical protein